MKTYITDNKVYSFCKIIICTFNSVWFRLKVIGADNMPKTGGVLVVPNHASYIDPTTIASGFDREVHYLAKRELFQGLLGWFLKKVNAHPISRTGVDRTALKLCVDLLKQGDVLMLFPEGTRTKDGEIQEIRPGAAMIAAQAGVPLLPVYIDGSLDVMPPGAKFPRRKNVRVYVGEPIALPERGEMPTKEYYELISRRIFDNLVNLKTKSSLSLQ